jgi:hypothetical protein
MTFFRLKYSCERTCTVDPFKSKATAWDVNPWQILSSHRSLVEAKQNFQCPSLWQWTFCLRWQQFWPSHLEKKILALFSDFLIILKSWPHSVKEWPENQELVIHCSYLSIDHNVRPHLKSVLILYVPQHDHWMFQRVWQIVVFFAHNVTGKSQYPGIHERPLLHATYTYWLVYLPNCEYRSCNFIVALNSILFYRSAQEWKIFCKSKQIALLMSDNSFARALALFLSIRAASACRWSSSLALDTCVTYLDPHVFAQFTHMLLWGLWKLRLKDVLDIWR